ncbi:hypothetical protein DFJ74DRAFT_110186 [Hyaloraphidium curvatum]|nr:hypothetical protein DFJ74DRAFT_110186 [Hyaloraphidium curvatum]
MDIDTDGGLQAPDAPTGSQASSPSREPDIVAISFVQGPKFLYLRQTLAAFPTSIFAPHFSPTHPLNAGRTPPSSFLLDRDPELFARHVDPLLRGYSVPGKDGLPPPGTPERAMLRDDALFYGLEALAEELEEPKEEADLERVLCTREGRESNFGRSWLEHGQVIRRELYLAHTARFIAALDSGALLVVLNDDDPDAVVIMASLKIPAGPGSEDEFVRRTFGVRMVGLASFCVAVGARPRNTPAYEYRHIRIKLHSWEDDHLEALLGRIAAVLEARPGWTAKVDDVVVKGRSFCGDVVHLLQTRLDETLDPQSMSFVSSLMPRGLTGSVHSSDGLLRCIDGRGENAVNDTIIVVENPILVFDGPFFFNGGMEFYCIVFGDLDSARAFHSALDT